jgi:hypothetical protein
MEDAVFQSQLYHDAVSDTEEIQVGDMVAWEHDESVHGEVIELLSNEYVDMVRFRTRDGEIKEMLLDECVKA